MQEVADNSRRRRMLITSPTSSALARWCGVVSVVVKNRPRRGRLTDVFDAHPQLRCIPHTIAFRLDVGFCVNSRLRRGWACFQLRPFSRCFYQWKFELWVAVLPQASVTVISTVWLRPRSKRSGSMTKEIVAVLPSSSKRANFPSISPR